MKHWQEIQPKKIKLTGCNRIISIKKENGKVRLREECDGYFSINIKKDQAIEILQEAIDWINEDTH